MEIRTNRLYIRDLHASDWREVQEIFIDFNNSEYAVYDMPLPTEDSKAKSLVEQFAESGLFFVVCLSEKIIGYICFHVNDGKYDLGYCFHSSYHLKGYAYESIQTLIEYFAKEHGVHCFTAGTAVKNIPSCSLLKKLGFDCVSTEKVSFDGKFSFQGANFLLYL